MMATMSTDTAVSDLACMYDWPLCISARTCESEKGPEYKQLTLKEAVRADPPPRLENMHCLDV